MIYLHVSILHKTGLYMDRPDIGWLWHDHTKPDVPVQNRSSDTPVRLTYNNFCSSFHFLCEKYNFANWMSLQRKLQKKKKHLTCKE